MTTNTCTKCGEPAEFGYKIEGALEWFCAEHRLKQNYADVRQTPNPRVISVEATVCEKHRPSKPLPPTPERKLAGHAKAIKAAGTRVVSDVLEIGRHLIEAKKLCGHGNWQPWLEREFGWTDRTALRFMQVYANRTSVSDLDLPLSGLYLLAAPSTPPQARQEVADRSGERLSVAEVKETITQAKADSPSAKRAEARCAAQWKAFTAEEERNPPSYVPDDIIDQVVVLFKGLAQNDQHRCVRRLSGILRGETS